MKGYLAGPMRGVPLFNFPAFDKAAALLRSKGHVVVSPAEHDREIGFDETSEDLSGFDMRAAILWDLAQVAVAECLWCLPGWHDSAGAKVEVALARFFGLPVFEAPCE